MATNTDQLTPAQIIKNARERRGITQDQVIANTTIPTKSMLSDYENGKTGVARSKHLRSLAEYIGLTQDELLQINPLLSVQASPELVERRHSAIDRKMRRYAKTTEPVRGDVTIPEAVPGHFNQLTYDRKSLSGYVVTEAGGMYWIWREGRVPTGHKVLGALLGWSIEALPELP